MTLLWSLVTLHALHSPYWDMSTGNVALLSKRLGFLFDQAKF